MTRIKATNSIEPCVSLYSAIGVQETTATRSLAYILARFPVVTKSLVRKLIPRIRVDFKNMEILAEESQHLHGRTDIEMVGANFHVILEGKVRNAIPGAAQLQRYFSRLEKSRRVHKKLVLLVDSIMEGRDQAAEVIRDFPKMKNMLVALTWADVLEMIDDATIADSGPNKPILFQYWNFLRSELHMKAFEKEVMIVLLTDKFKYGEGSHPDILGLSSYEAAFTKRMYQGSEKKIKSVLYLGFKYKGLFKHIARVRKQERRGKDMVFFFEEPIELPIAPRKVPFEFRGGIQHSNFQKLIDPRVTDFKGIIERQNA